MKTLIFNHQDGSKRVLNVTDQFSETATKMFKGKKVTEPTIPTLEHDFGGTIAPLDVVEVEETIVQDKELLKALKLEYKNQVNEQPKKIKFQTKSGMSLERILNLA
jgi:hypothetical protein